MRNLDTIGRVLDRHELLAAGLLAYAVITLVILLTLT